MFSGGIGSIDKHLVRKEPPKAGMIVTKVGGPVYRIGVGGGAASSVQVQGKHTLHFILVIYTCHLLDALSPLQATRDQRN